jgi:hypothetical protein
MSSDQILMQKHKVVFKVNHLVDCTLSNRQIYRHSLMQLLPLKSDRKYQATN